MADANLHIRGCLTKRLGSLVALYLFRAHVRAARAQINYWLCPYYFQKSIRCLLGIGVLFITIQRKTRWSVNSKLYKKNAKLKKKLQKKELQLMESNHQTLIIHPHSIKAHFVKLTKTICQFARKPIDNLS